MAHLLVSLLWSRDLLFLLLMENGITNKDLDGGAGFSEGVTASRPSPLTEPLYTNILTTTSSPVHLSPRYTHHSFTLTFPALLRRVHSSSLLAYLSSPSPITRNVAPPIHPPSTNLFNPQFRFYTAEGWMGLYSFNYCWRCPKMLRGDMELH